MQPYHLSFLLLGVCILLLSINTLGAHAEVTFKCDSSWDKPDADNDIGQCLKDFVSMRRNIGYFIIPIILIIFTVLLTIIVPVIFVFNSFCCEDYCFSFTRTTNLARSRCWLWMLISINFFWSVFSAILIIYGSSLLSSSLKKSTDYIRGDALSYFDRIKSTITELLTNYTDPKKPVPPPIDLSAFTTMKLEISKKVDSVRDNYFVYMEGVRTASVIVGVIGILLMISCIVIACCRFNTMGALSFGIIYYIFAVIYAIMCVVLALFTCLIFAFCGEITLHNRREPGIFQWYYVPWCKKEFKLESTRDEISKQTATKASQICDQVSKMCSSTLDMDLTKPFQCSDKIDCSTIEDASELIYSVKAKPDLSDMLCVNTTDWVYQESCTVFTCSTSCVDYEKPDLKAKTMSQNAMNFLKFAINRSSAMSYVLPVMDCNFVMDKFISVFQTDKETGAGADGYGVHCSNLRVASTMLTVGFFTGAIMFVLSVYVTQQGIWMWNDAAEVENIKEAQAMSIYQKSNLGSERGSQMSRTESFVNNPKVSVRRASGILSVPSQSNLQMYPSMRG